MIALCAAESLPKKNDLYLDDNMHHALSEKFTKDFESMGFMKLSITEKVKIVLKYSP